MSNMFKELLKKGIKHVLLVTELNDDELKEKRLATCKGCVMYDKIEETCIHCGCYVEIKAGMLVNRNPKKRMRTEITHCPEGKWGDKDISQYYLI